MKIYACPKCGSTNISQGTLGEGVLTGYVNKDVCKKCGYHGMPFIFDSENEYKKFLEGLAKEKESKDNNVEKEDYKTTEPQPVKKLKTERPTGIIILSILMILEAVFVICLYYSLLGPNINQWLWVYYIIVFFISAVLLPYGFLKAKGWAWTIGAILFALSIPIGLIFLYYLTRPHVKAYFGKT